MMGELRQWIALRWAKWLNHRIPVSSQVTLNQKRVFILPTVLGYCYLASAFLLFMAGVNYDNSLILCFSFFLGSLFVVSILQTYVNLAGLVITAGSTQNAFAGKPSNFIVHLAKSKEKDHHSIECFWCGYSSEPQNLIKTIKVTVDMLLPTKRRGRYDPGRMKIQTVYPFGFCRAWTWVDLGMSCWVYPAPEQCSLPRTQESMDPDGSTHSIEGSEDFDGLRRYHEGDSLKNVDWKSYARRGALYSKQFHGYQSSSNWVDWNSLSVQQAELKLSQMCFWVLELAKTNAAFGLRLPGKEIAPSSGEAHVKHCLEALARF